MTGCLVAVAIVVVAAGAWGICACLLSGRISRSEEQHKEREGTARRS